MPYNLTFLINPATESLFARQLKLALRKWSSPQPAVVALAAKDDSATGKAWPLAMLMPNGVHNRDYVLDIDGVPARESQKSYVTTTVGNDRRQWTHRVTVDGAVEVSPEINVTAQNLEREAKGFFYVRLRGEKRGTVAQCRVVEQATTSAPHQIDSKAYWVIPLNKTILTGHGGVASENGIFCESMSDLMAGIIRQVEAVRRDAPSVPMTHPGSTEKSDAPPPSNFPIKILVL